jgi:crotonobetainyl-CoA:carnitine CoA-transferase CaiB-like acyl-CoA transferase
MHSTQTKPAGALADLRVLELGTLIAGPFCGQLLGDMGAEVIKIEAPGPGRSHASLGDRRSAASLRCGGR